MCVYFLTNTYLQLCFIHTITGTHTFTLSHTGTHTVMGWLKQIRKPRLFRMTTNRLSLNTDKTELLWTGSRHSLSQFQGLGPALQLGADIVTARDQV